MSWKIVLKGRNPSGRVLAVLYARTGESIDSAKSKLASPEGIVLQRDLSQDDARNLVKSLPDDGSVDIRVVRDNEATIPVLMGYRPGSRGRLRVALQKLSKLSTEDVIHFLSRIPIVLKPDSDRATAEAIKRVLERSGGIVEIRAPEDLSGIAGVRRLSSFSARTAETVSPMVFAKRKVVAPVKTGVLLEQEEKTASVLPPETVRPPVVRALSTPVAFSRPHVVSYTLPEVTAETAPDVIEDFPRESPVFIEPHAFRFTVPAVPVPARLPSTGISFVLPPVSPSNRIVPLYLFPVASREKDRVVSSLSGVAGINPDRIERCIDRAPALLTGYASRTDALEALTELSKMGVPVSLLPQSGALTQAPAGDYFFNRLYEH